MQGSYGSICHKSSQESAGTSLADLITKILPGPRGEELLDMFTYQSRQASKFIWCHVLRGPNQYCHKLVYTRSLRYCQIL